MWESFVEALRAQLANQVVAGAIALGLVGVLAAALRKVPGALWSQAKRAFVVTATLDSRNDLFPAFVAWMDEQRFGRRSRWFSVVQAPPAVAGDDAEADDAPPLQYSPAPGFHLFWYRGRLMWLHRDIAMNLQVVETIRLGALFASRRLMEELMEGVVRRAAGAPHASGCRSTRSTAGASSGTCPTPSRAAAWIPWCSTKAWPAACTTTSTSSSTGATGTRSWAFPGAAATCCTARRAPARPAWPMRWPASCA
jgi:hypothetical protein